MRATALQARKSEPLPPKSASHRPKRNLASLSEPHTSNKIPPITISVLRDGADNTGIIGRNLRLWHDGKLARGRSLCGHWSAVDIHIPIKDAHVQVGQCSATGIGPIKPPFVQLNIGARLETGFITP